MTTLTYISNRYTCDGLTITVSGLTWLSCLGQVDEEVCRIQGPDATLLQHLMEEGELERAVNALDANTPYSRQGLSTPEDNFTLVPGGDERELYPLSDWQEEVRQGDTRLGYNEWVQHRKEADANVKR